MQGREILCGDTPQVKQSIQVRCVAMVEDVETPEEQAKRKRSEARTQVAEYMNNFATALVVSAAIPGIASMFFHRDWVVGAAMVVVAVAYFFYLVAAFVFPHDHDHRFRHVVYQSAAFIVL